MSNDSRLHDAISDLISEIADLEDDLASKRLALADLIGELEENDKTEVHTEIAHHDILAGDS